MSSASFYSGLAPFTELSGAGRKESYTPLPADWHVAMCDVRDSTAAVESGNYKNVNTLGAALITAVLNAAGGTEVPFVFEGDGAMLCVPPELLERARAALLQTREMARRSFGLDLRIATMPVARVREAGRDILVGRYRVSEHYDQAMFAGGGMAWAERCMKDPGTAPLYRVDEASVRPEGSFEGLECRWEDIPSRHGETVSLMVLALHYEPERSAAVYRNVINKVREIYGDDDACHPVAVPELAMTLKADLLADELGVRTGKAGGFERWRRLMRTRAIVLLGKLLMHFGIRTHETDWSLYKTTLARNSDVRKFSDVYRQILSGTPEQRLQLDAWLQQQFKSRNLLYGLHVADRAHMTCLVFDYSGRHLHFIDGADGGLFLAAKAFKERANQYVSRTGI